MSRKHLDFQLKFTFAEMANILTFFSIDARQLVFFAARAGSEARPRRNSAADGIS
jgi:hypothetical protein